MEEYTADVFANRDEPLPLLTVPHDDETSSSEPDTSERKSSSRRSTLPTRQSLQDRMFNKLFSQIIPSEDLDRQDDPDDDRHESDYVKRPAFSLTVMGNNFRRFNARIGIVFVFQNQVGQLLGWRTPTHTLSLLAVYTFVCLDPYLLIALPLAIALLFIMIPAFTSRHPPPPPPPTTSVSVRDDSLSAYSYSGPAIAPARTIKPAPETSKDFFRNMRDLQNSMADFSNLHDVLVSTVTPVTNFSNEVLSSTIFLYLTVLTAVLFISAHLIPFRLISLIGGYAVIISNHPKVQLFLMRQKKRADKKAMELAQASEAGQQTSLVVAGIPVKLPDNSTIRTLQSTLSTMSEITLSSTPETREVEVFELQNRPILPATSSALSSSLSANPEVYEWSPHLFTPSPYDPLSPSRIAGERPRGTRFFEDVQPPAGWEWGSKKWVLDLEVGEWVNERLIVGVEYDIMHDDLNEDDNQSDNDTENTANVNQGETDTTPNNNVANADHGGLSATITTTENFAATRKRQQSINLDFGGWVWDLPPAVGSTGNRDEEVWLAYGDYDIPSLSREQEQKRQEFLRKEMEKNKERGHKKSTSSKGSLKSIAGSIGKKNKKKGKGATAGGAVVGGTAKDWEEGVRMGNKGRTGEWRRRRWVRVVKRKTVLQ